MKVKEWISNAIDCLDKGYTIACRKSLAGALAALDEKPESRSEEMSELQDSIVQETGVYIQSLEQKIDWLEQELANMRTYSHETVRGLVDWRDKRIKELEHLLSSALPRIECLAPEDSNLITAIGEALKEKE